MSQIEEASQLWSPAMRKWLRDSEKHGLRLYFQERGRPYQERWAGGGVPYLERMTDDEGLRVLDSTLGRFNSSQPRRIDSPTSHRGPTPPLLAPAATGVTTMNVKVAGQTILNFRKRFGL